MVGIVAEEHQTVVLDLEIEATVNTSVGLQAVAQLVGSTSCQLGHGHGCNTVFDVDGHGLPQCYILHRLDGRDEVEGNLAVLDTDILSMEITLGKCIVVTTYPSGNIFLHLQSTMDDQCSFGLDKLCIVAETLQVSLFGAIDVQVVGVGTGNHRHIWRQPVERAVKLVGFNDHKVGIGEDIVGAVVLGDTTQEGITVKMALVHDVGTHGGRGGLTVCTSHTESLMLTCQGA